MASAFGTYNSSNNEEIKEEIKGEIDNIFKNSTQIVTIPFQIDPLYYIYSLIHFNFLFFKIRRNEKYDTVLIHKDDKQIYQVGNQIDHKDNIYGNIKIVSYIYNISNKTYEITFHSEFYFYSEIIKGFLNVKKNQMLKYVGVYEIIIF